MLRIFASLFLSGLAAFACVPGLANGQTGPAGPAPAVAPQQPAGLIKFDNQTLPKMIQDAGFQVQAKVGSWQLTAQQNGWNYVVDVVPVTAANGQMVGFFLRSELGNPTNGTAESLLKMLQSNHTQPFHYFSHNVQSNKLVLNYQFVYGDSNVQEMQKVVNDFFTKVRDTYALWGSQPTNAPAPVPTTPSPAGAPATPQVNTPPQQVAAFPQQAVGLWKGQESFNGGGAVSFQLYQNGQATMIVPQGSYQGTWTQNGTQVKIELPTAQNTYTGTMNGTILSGQGMDKNGVAWNFTVGLQK